MIVVAIIGILAAIALPAYQNYMIKSKLVEATTDLDAAKVAVTEGYSTNGNTWPPANTVSGAPQNAKNVSAITYTPGTGTTANGSIVATISATIGNTAVDGAFLGLFGQGMTDGTITWSCGTAKTNGDVKPAGVTTMYPFIPSNCQQ
jgi:type IV pilus assembly protein PilA